MQFTKYAIWINDDRRICELETDGSVTFAEDASPEELKWAVGVLLREAECKRKHHINLSMEEKIPVFNKIKEMNRKSAVDAAMNEMTRINQETGQYDSRPNPLIKKHKCPDCRCQPGCCCCHEGHCGCKQNRIEEEL